MAGSLRNYQIVLIGPNANSTRDRVVNALRSRVNELGDKIWDCVEILENASAGTFDKSAPVFGVWIGSAELADPKHLAVLDELLHEAKTVLPVVSDLGLFTAETPHQLHGINGLPLDASNGSLDRVINSVLEGMQLLRRRRRIFISYARKDSRAAAKQLFGSLAECGFDVFLDTHSVPASSVFQNQLWHSMVDSDLVVLLDSNGVDASHWCRQEYERADALSVGIIRVLWPDRKVAPATDALLFSLQLILTKADFESSTETPTQNDKLTDDALARIAQHAEGFRARSIAARQANLVTTFQREASKYGITTTIQPNSHILIEKPDKNKVTKRIAVVPAVGVPISTNFHDAFIEYGGNPPNTDAQVVLYDRQGFLPHWVDHLTWLNGSLPVRGIDVTEIARWLSTP